MWTKDGEIYTSGGIVVGNLWHSNPSPEQFRAAGWAWVEETPNPDEAKDE